MNTRIIFPPERTYNTLFFYNLVGAILCTILVAACTSGQVQNNKPELHPKEFPGQVESPARKSNQLIRKKNSAEILKMPKETKLQELPPESPKVKNNTPPLNESKHSTAEINQQHPDHLEANVYAVPVKKPIAVKLSGRPTTDTPNPGSDAHFGEDQDCSSTPSSIRVTLTNIKDQRGTIIAELYRNVPSEFLDQNFMRDEVVVDGKEVALCFLPPAPGYYAIALYHDRNDNRKLDKNWFGIPKEPVGVSRNYKSRLRAPRYDEAKFKATTKGADLKIILRKIF